jgi:hypothetical protein
MHVTIRKLSTGVIQVTIAGVTLSEDDKKIIRYALTRHITEMCASIEMAAAHPEMAEKRKEAVENRRQAFMLIECFDMVNGEVNSVQRWLGDFSMEVPDRYVPLLYHAMLWYRNNWVDQDEREEAATRLLKLLEKCLPQ